MINYEYRCNKCGQYSIKIYPFGKPAKHPKCPKCRHKMDRIFSPIQVVYKGAGFYASEHRREQIEKNCDKVDKED